MTDARRCGTCRWWGEPDFDWWAPCGWTPTEPFPPWIQPLVISRGNYYPDCPAWQGKDAMQPADGAANRSIEAHEEPA